MGTGRFIFINDPEDSSMEFVNSISSIQLDNYQNQDLQRYCYKLYCDKDIPIDFNKQVKIALDWYLKKEFTEQEQKNMDRIKKEEIDQIEAERKARLPKFSWDLKNKIKKGK